MSNWEFFSLQQSASVSYSRRKGFCQTNSLDNRFKSGQPVFVVCPLRVTLIQEYEQEEHRSTAYEAHSYHTDHTDHTDQCKGWGRGFRRKGGEKHFRGRVSQGRGYLCFVSKDWVACIWFIEMLQSWVGFVTHKYALTPIWFYVSLPLAQKSNKNFNILENVDLAAKEDQKRTACLKRYNNFWGFCFGSKIMFR